MDAGNTNIPEANLNEYGVIIQSARDKKEFDYILQIRGADWVSYAIKNLIGNRKPYVSNLAKIMCLDIPDNLPDRDKVLPIEQGLAMLKEVRKFKKKEV